MSIEDAVTLFLANMSAQVPILIAACTGLYFSIKRRQQAPRAFRMAAWGFSLLIARAVVGPAMAVAMLRMRINTGIDGVPEAYLWPNILAAATYVLFLAALVLLARAVFLDRELPRPSE